MVYNTLYFFNKINGNIIHIENGMTNSTKIQQKTISDISKEYEIPEYMLEIKELSIYDLDTYISSKKFILKVNKDSNEFITTNHNDSIIINYNNQTNKHEYSIAQIYNFYNDYLFNSLMCFSNHLILGALSYFFQ